MVTTYAYDGNDRRIKTIYPDGSEAETIYGINGRVSENIDQKDYSTVFGYDLNGNLISVEDAKGQTSQYEYDEADNKVAFTNSLGNTWRWNYDALGRVIRHELPDDTNNSKYSYYDYDLYGNLTYETYYSSHSGVFHNYDINNNRVSTNYETNSAGAYETETVSYDNEGNRKSATDKDGGTRVWDYDVRYRLKSDLKANGDLLEYSYDPVGNRESLTVTTTDGLSFTTTYEFDALNRLKGVVDSNNYRTGYTYDAEGNQKTITYPNGVVTVFGYDGLNRLTRKYSNDSNGQILQDFVYTLDLSGHRERIEEITSGRVSEYIYDELYQLISETTTAPDTGSYVAVYEYDSAGNRTKQTINGTVTDFDYKKDNRLFHTGLNWSHDNKGRFVSYSEGNREYDFTYNNKNELSHTEITENGVVIEEYDYVYDIDGIRTQTINSLTGETTHYLVDHNRDYAQVLLETNSDTQATIDYLYGDDLIRQSQNSTEERYYLYDGLGSTQALTDETGLVTDNYTYEAFGQLLSHTGSSENTYLFAGEQYDPTSLSYRLRARNYLAPTGRFTRMDDWEGEDYRPLSLNKYLYTEGNPVNGIDPTGYFTLNDIVAALRVQATTLKAGNASYINTQGRRLVWDGVCFAVEELAQDQLMNFAETIYVFNDHLANDRDYIGRSKNPARRLKDHERNRKALTELMKREEQTLFTLTHVLEVVVDQEKTQDKISDVLRALEDHLIEAEGGPNNKSNPEGRLANKRKEIDRKKLKNNKKLEKIVNKLKLCD